MLVVFAGLPGVGKTALAKEVARRAGATYLRIDSIEAALAESSLKIDPAEDAGYAVAYVVAEDNLRLGQFVVADSVNPIALTRTAWLAAAQRAGSEAVEVEIICSDRAEHRRRVEERRADNPDKRLPSWQDVLDREYHRWEPNWIAIDTAGRTVEQSVIELLPRLPFPIA